MTSSADTTQVGLRIVSIKWKNPVASRAAYLAEGKRITHSPVSTSGARAMMKSSAEAT